MCNSESIEERYNQQHLPFRGIICQSFSPLTSFFFFIFFLSSLIDFSLLHTHTYTHKKFSRVSPFSPFFSPSDNISSTTYFTCQVHETISSLLLLFAIRMESIAILSFTSQIYSPLLLLSLGVMGALSQESLSYDYLTC